MKDEHDNLEETEHEIVPDEFSQAVDEWEVVLDKKKGRSKKPFIVLTTIVVILVLGGVGFSIWHEQPSFCNAICHSPMDNYVEGYNSGDSALLVSKHAQADIVCLQCHESNLSEQITEGVAWLKGDFYVDEEGFVVNDDDETLATREFCLTCHDDGDSNTGEDWGEIVLATAEWGGDEGVNPHSSHNGDEKCGDCHNAHGTSVMACNQCHGWDVPDGWIMPKVY